MGRRSLAWNLYPTLLGVILLGMGGLGVYAWYIAGAITGISVQLVAAALAFAVLTAGVGVLATRRISQPLKEMAQGARRFAGGDFKHKLHVPNVAEFAALADALNEMATQLDDKIKAIVAQTNQQEGVLASMLEGVLAVDTDGRIISINRAASELAGTGQSAAQGRHIHEVVRNADLLKFVTRALRSDSGAEGEVVLREGPRERLLQVRGTRLCDARGQDIGALLVLNDITQLHHLETVRRDFVANVSHELKTPITSIKGFVETLREGALEDPASAQRFLEIIARQAERLNQIIDDLLALSRIEREAHAASPGSAVAGVECEPTPLRTLLQAAVDDCVRKSQDRNIRIVLECDVSLRPRLNAQLIEQAVVNLLDNAMKYSEAGSPVQVRAWREDSQVHLAVEDAGCGIQEDHLERIFERFYRVDKARSRQMGGTGLGLAIVKHIAQAHGGKVGVQSRVGQGSTFTISLPYGE